MISFRTPTYVMDGHPARKYCTGNLKALIRLKIEFNQSLYFVLCVYCGQGSRVPNLQNYFEPSTGKPRLRIKAPTFGHVFSSDGYSAGYYSYIWSDVISADAYDAFVEAGGPYNKAVAARLRKYVFSVGNTIDPADAYRTFRGRDPKIEALMRKRGFPVNDSKKGKLTPAKPKAKSR